MRSPLIAAAILIGRALSAQVPPAVPDVKKEPAEPGIAVASAVVKAKCGGCHKR